MSQENTETYLNLNSDQFNSWIQEFDNKYNQVEKEFLNKENNDVKNLILSESDNSVEIQSDSESEDYHDNNSNIFIKQKNLEDFNYSESSVNIQSSSQQRRLLFNKTRVRTTPQDTNETTSNQLKLNKNDIINKQEIKNSDRKRSDRHSNKVNIRSDRKDDRNFVPEFEILTFNQLNSILPDFDFNISKQSNTIKNTAIINENNEHKNVVKENNLNRNVNIDGIKLKNTQIKTKLGEAALYRFISRRRF